MICCSTNGNGFHFVFARNTTEIRPQARFQLRCDEGKSLLRAENTVHEVADIGMRHRESLLSAVRFTDCLPVSHLIPALKRWAISIRPLRGLVTPHGGAD